MGSPETVLGAANSLQLVAEQLADTVAGKRYRQFGMLIEALSRLLNWRRAIRSAEVDADRYLRSAQLMAREVSQQVAGDSDAAKLVAVAAQISRLSDVDGMLATARSLMCIPLPLPMFAGSPRTAGSAAAQREPQKKPPAVAVAFTSFMIDGVRFAEPHTVEPQVIHDLTVEVALSRWPEGARELVLEPVSVEPHDSYQLPVFSFGRPAGDPPYSMTKSGRMVLRWPQTFFARPLEFSYRARFSPDLDGVQLIVQGQRHLRVQCFDPDRDPQSGYAQIDGRLLELRAEARSLPAVSDRELSDFLMLFAAVGGVAGQSLQDNLFPRTYPEREFQEEIKKLLRRNPRIGSELEEHPRAGGGITDLSFRGIRLELKVEPDRPLAIEDAGPFVEQAAQYVVGSDRRFGLLALLDCSPKTQAPGPAPNDIFLRLVPSPTGGRLAICLGVVIVRGNLARPSTLSKA